MSQYRERGGEREREREEYTDRTQYKQKK